MNAPSRLRFRSSLMLGCAACGLAMTWSRPALAQAFQAFPTTVFGNVTYNRATPGVETVTVNSNSAVIDWSISPPAPNPFVFLPAGNVATFRNGINNTDFVALNRILVNVPVRFDGRVVSQLVSASGTTAGGTLLFSTPGGIIIGANAVFDVGNLVLTTLNVNVDAAGNFYDPATRGFTFTGSLLAAPNGSVTTEAGARINALSPNSYVAFVAPTIGHAGNVQVNGAAAYIAGNQVEMRANDGLFDIIVAVGTDSANPITHTGTTGGPASTGAADIHRIYMVAIPRNQAITTLLEGNIGFANAVSASVENGEIILSAGYNVVGGSVDASAPVNPGFGASLSIDGGTISSALTGYAVTDAIASGFAGGQLHATQDLTLVGGQTAALSATPGDVMIMDRNVTLISPGGSAGIVASTGSSVTVSGNVLIDATGTGFSPPSNVSADATDGIGGEATIYSDGGTIAISGNATLLARGIGGHASYQVDQIGAGGNGEGGLARIIGTNGGTVAISGNLTADASGVGGFTTGYAANVTLVPGATGEGGHVYVIGAGGGAVTVTGSSTLSANGRGGASIYTAGGAGSGDEIFIQASGGAVTLTGPVTISAAGTGGQGASGGAGTGGELDVNAFRGNVRILGATTADLTGRGGSALTAAAAGNGTGGAIRIFAESDTGVIDIAAFDGHADGIGASGSNGANGGAGGSGQGGNADIETSTDQIVVGARPGMHFGALSVTANGAGGAGGTSAANGIGGAAGAGTGGQVTLAASQARIAVDGQVALGATGTGGAASAGGGPGGTGAGGSITASADRTSLVLGNNAVVGANGLGGAGPTGGAGLGGSVQIRALGGPTPSSVSGGIVAVSATGQGGTGANAGAATPAGRGGNGTGGSIVMLADAVRGSIAFGATSADPGGTGGSAGTAPSLALSGRGGDGIGGSVTAGTEQRADPNCTTPATCAAAASGSATFASLGLSAAGTGGQGGAGGNGSGGTATLQSVGAPTIVTGAATLRADGVAGAGVGGGTAGQAQGGLLVLSASPHSTTGTTGQLQAGSVDGSAIATGGAAGSTAGRWQVSASGGSTITATDVTLSAFAQGTPAPAPAPVSSIDVNNGVLSVTGTANLTAAGDIRLNAAAGGQVRGGDYVLNSQRDIIVSHANRGAAPTISVANFSVNGGRDVTFNAGALSRASTSFRIVAPRLATIADLIAAPDIQINSGDIDIPGTGFIGDSATTSVGLTVFGVDSAGGPQTVIGGTTQGPGYTLTNAEANRIRTRSLSILAPTTGTTIGRAPDVIVRDLALAAPNGANGPGVNLLNIGAALGGEAFGVIQVEGNLLLANAGAADGIRFDAAQQFQLITPTGSIRVRDAAGNPGGTLTINSDNIWAVSQAIFDRLHADSAYAARDADLADNGGTLAPRGYIEANAVTLNAGNSLFVQNTGENPTNQFSLTGPAFGGVTVGPGGLIIRATGTSPASVTAFGRRINADGSVTIGYDFFFAVNFQVAGGASLLTGYTAASTFNTCVIATGQCPLRRPKDTGPGGRDPITGPTGTFQLPPGLGDDNVDTSFATEPLIEEPVTSGGESTLWTPPCIPEHDRRCDGVHP